MDKADSNLELDFLSAIVKESPRRGIPSGVQDHQVVDNRIIMSINNI